MSLSADQAAAIEALVRPALAGDQTARQSLCLAVTPHLYVRLRCMKADPPDIEDILQETWLRVFRKRDQFDTGRRFLPWVTQIACNVLRDRRRSRRPTAALPQENLEAKELGPIDLMRAAEDVQKVRECVERLAAHDRRIIVLRFWHDRSFDEIHAELGGATSLAATRSRYYRALNQLLECLNLNELKTEN
jgi:RNA polymerase sigma-70 factor (ECF subfamily)